MTSPFGDAWLKIERAREHIKQFSVHVREFSEANGHDIRVYRDTNTGYDTLEFIPSKAIPPELMCIVGDAVHNLRSALDVAMSQIEFLTTDERTDDVIFPVYKRREYFEKAVESRLKGKAPERVINYIVDSIQPYETGNGAPIWQLHRLDIEDKHRVIIPKLQFEWIRNVRYIDETGEEFSIPDEWVITNARRVVYPTEKRGVQVTHKGHSSVSVLFGKGMPFESKHVFPTLNNLAPIIVGTLLALEREFSKSQGK